MATLTTARPTSLAPLLVGYVAGDVTAAALARFDDLFEDASVEERAAFARFYLDALTSGEYAEALPHPSEVDGILSAARA